MPAIASAARSIAARLMGGLPSACRSGQTEQHERDASIGDGSNWRNPVFYYVNINRMMQLS